MADENQILGVIGIAVKACKVRVYLGDKWVELEPAVALALADAIKKAAEVALTREHDPG